MMTNGKWKMANVKGGQTAPFLSHLPFAILHLPSFQWWRWYLVVLPLLAACAPVPSVSPRRLIAHQAMLDFSGLLPVTLQSDVNVYVSVPSSWKRLAAERVPRIVHQQWRSPTRETGLGIAYLDLPFHVSPKLLIWFAKMEYAKQTTPDGKPRGQLLSEWTDAEGREWFDAESDRYHVQGYAVTSGSDAWVVYAGYKVRSGLNWPEWAMAMRSIETALPAPLVGAD